MKFSTWHMTYERLRRILQSGILLSTASGPRIWSSGHFRSITFLSAPSTKRFIELIFERKAQDAFAGRYAASLSTSIHFFDQTAHAYIHAVSDDLGMKYLGFYSAEMRDLLMEEERKRFEKFASLLFTAVQEKIPVQRENAPLVWPSLSYVPGRATKNPHNLYKKGCHPHGRRRQFTRSCGDDRPAPQEFFRLC